MNDTALPAIQLATYNEDKDVQFPCIWNGTVRTETISKWSRLTGINRNTIKTRFYSERTPRECLGLDKIVPKKSTAPPRCSRKRKEQRQAAIANQFLCSRW